MRTTKLIVLLQTFSPAEIRAFDKFVNSKYFNHSQKLIVLWEQLKKTVSKFDDKKWSREKLFSKVFKGEKFDDNKLRQLMSRLLKLAEKFLIIEDLEKKEIDYQLATAQVYYQKGLKENYEKITTKQLDNLSSEAFLTPQAIYQKLSLHHQLYFNEFNRKGDAYCTHFVESTRLLEQYYHQQKLIYTIEWLSRNLRYHYDIPQSIVGYVDALKKKPFEENKVGIVIILENAVRLLTTPNDEVFQQIKKQFFSNYEMIDKKIKNLLFRLLINYCVGRNDKGKNVNKEIFQLYELGLEDGAIFYKGLMTNVTFINIVSNALIIGENEWVKSFIKSEIFRMYEPQKELYQQFANAITLFFEHQYQDCLSQLSKLEKSDLIILEVPRRNLHLRTIFECYIIGQIHIKSLYAQLESYQKYLKRKSILSTSKRKAYQNFGSFLLRLVKWCETEGSEKKLVKLNEELRVIQPFPSLSREWLLNHINILKKKNGVESQLHPISTN